MLAAAEMVIPAGSSTAPAADRRAPWTSEASFQATSQLVPSDETAGLVRFAAAERLDPSGSSTEAAVVRRAAQMPVERFQATR